VIIWKLSLVGKQTFRKLNGAELLYVVQQGVPYVPRAGDHGLVSG